ncbi:serine/threonine-protein kinase [Clostridium sardiniense]|uniref:serine/threonine-protein kinase n=1 Tax=Clostridium sardiniense TaxID=29369 RepID=UPI003D33C0D5
MDNLVLEYKLSCYKELTKLNENNKSKIYLVENTNDKKIYIKKVLTNYNLRIYETIKETDFKNLPKIYEVFRNNESLIVIEEYIHGDTLKEIVENKGIIKEEKVIEYMISLCDVLEHLHNMNPPIIHRDIKPSNIIISSDDVLKLIDFDVSREYKEGVNEDTKIQGTEEYAPPEQFGFIQTDGRSDIYSVGILMNVLTTGTYPKNKLNNGYLQNIIKKSIEFSPSDRYQNVSELKRDLLMLKEGFNKSVDNVDDSTVDKKRKMNLLDLTKRDDNSTLNVNLENVEGNSNDMDKSTSIADEIKDINKSEDKISIKNFYKIIPGFRTGVLWKKILACCGYGFLVIGLFTTTGTEGTKSVFLENLYMVVALLALIFLYSNFLNLKVKLPLLKSDNKFKVLGGYVLYTIIIFFILGLLLESNKI